MDKGYIEPSIVKTLASMYPFERVSKWQLINTKTLKFWVGRSIYIFRYTSPTEWSIETLKSWQKEMKGD